MFTLEVSKWTDSSLSRRWLSGPGIAVLTEGLEGSFGKKAFVETHRELWHVASSCRGVVRFRTRLPHRIAVASAIVTM